jgi:ribosomal protein L7/L12
MQLWPRFVTASPDVDVNESVLRQAERVLAEGRSAEDVLVPLKDRGANAIASIRALQRLLGASVADAQQLVRERQAWREMR